MSKILILFILYIFCIISPTWAREIVCTSYPVWLLTSEITADTRQINVRLLAPPENGCTHDYTPSPRDLRNLNAAGTILVCNGMSVDEHIVKSARKINKNLYIITASAPEDIFDEHNFASPDTAQRMVERIANALSELDRENSAIYQANAQQLQQQLIRLVRKANAIALPRQAVLQNNVLKNLSRLLKYEFLVIHDDHSNMLSAQSLRNLLDKIKLHKSTVILAEKSSHSAQLKVIQQATRLPVITLDLMLSGPSEPPENYYISVMESNLAKLAQLERK